MKKLVILLGLLALASCRRSAEQQSIAGAVKIAACDLVTKNEVAAIQGTTVSEATQSEGAIGSLRATQCYYTSTEPNKSVTVGVIQAQSGQPGDPLKFWRDTFDESGEPRDRSESKNGSREEGEEKHKPPTRITGIGDEACWAANAIGGIFYVLKKDKHLFLRISVGGPETTDIKLEKSKKIAEDALRRL